MKAATKTKRKPKSKAPARTGLRVEPAPPPGPAAPPPGTSWLASCVDCRGTVYAFPSACSEGGLNLIDPCEDDREWLRACCGWPTVLRFRSIEEHARAHRCEATFRRPRYRDTAPDRLEALKLLLRRAGLEPEPGPSGRTLRVAGRVASCDGGGWRLGWEHCAAFEQFDAAEDVLVALAVAACDGETGESGA